MLWCMRLAVLGAALGMLGSVVGTGHHRDEAALGGVGHLALPVDAAHQHHVAVARHAPCSVIIVRVPEGR